MKNKKSLFYILGVSQNDNKILTKLKNKITMR